MPSWREFVLVFLLRGMLNFGDSTTQVRRMYSHLVEQRHWLSKEQFGSTLRFCELLPGPETLQLAILVGFLKRKLQGGVLAGLLLILPGVFLIVLLSRIYVTHARTPLVTDFLFILKPAVLGIVIAGVIRLAAAKISTYILAAILAASFSASTFLETNLLLVIVAAGSINLLVSLGVPRLQRKTTQLRALAIPVFLVILSLLHPHWLKMGWLFLKTGLFSFGGPYASLAFLHQGAVEEYRWVSISQMLDGLVLSVALPGSLVLFSTFVGYLGGGLIGAILATLLVFMPSFVLALVGARHLEEISNNDALQSFLSGANAAVLGVLVFIIIEVSPVAFVGTGTVGIAISTFLAVALLNIEVAIVAVVSIAVGIVYAMGLIGRIGPIGL